MAKRSGLVMIWGGWLLFISTLVGAAQENNSLALTLHRDFGYSDGRGSIQDKFSLIVNGPEDLVRVVFYIDDQPIGEVNQAPFRLQFDTDDYPQGSHELKAIGFSSAGQELTSNILQRNFVTADESWQAGLKVGGQIAIGAILIIGLIALVAGGVTLLTNRNKPALPPGAARQYGWLGGAICPKCHRPFSIHLYGLNVGLSKYDCCPHCGKWSLVRRAGRDELAAAEKAELANVAQPALGALSEEENLRRRLDDSRFM